MRQLGFPGDAVVKNPPTKAGDARAGSLGQEDPLWRRAWQPTPIFLPGEFLGQRRLAGYSPCSHKELDMTEILKNETMSSWK